MVSSEPLFAPWTSMFADIEICGETRMQGKSLEKWRYGLERSIKKISQSKTEYMHVNERGPG